MLDRVPRAWMGRLLRYEEGDKAALEILHAAQLSICLYAAEGRPLDRASVRDGIEFARRRMSLIETPGRWSPLRRVPGDAPGRTDQAFGDFGGQPQGSSAAR
jgi:hypothetical protein